MPRTALLDVDNRESVLSVQQKTTAVLLGECVDREEIAGIVGLKRTNTISDWLRHNEAFRQLVSESYENWIQRHRELRGRAQAKAWNVIMKELDDETSRKRLGIALNLVLRSMQGR